MTQKNAEDPLLVSLFGFLPTPPSSMPLSFCVSQVIPQRSGFRTLLLLHVLPKMGLLLASLKGGATQKKFANGQARCRYCGNSIHLPMVSKNSLTPQEGLGHTEESERDQGEWKSSIVSWGGCVWDGWGIPHICHDPHEHIRVNFFWPL